MNYILYPFFNLPVAEFNISRAILWPYDSGVELHEQSGTQCAVN